MIYKLLSLIEMVKRWDKFLFYEVPFGLKGYNFYYFSFKNKIKNQSLYSFELILQIIVILTYNL